MVLLAGLLEVGAASAEPLDHFATTDDIGVNKVPHLGESHVLVIPHRTGETAFPAARLAELQDDATGYRARITGSHVFFTSSRHEEKLDFEVLLDRKTGDVIVTGR